MWYMIIMIILIACVQNYTLFLIRVVNRAIESLTLVLIVKCQVIVLPATVPMADGNYVASGSP